MEQNKAFETELAEAEYFWRITQMKICEPVYVCQNRRFL